MGKVKSFIITVCGSCENFRGFSPNQPLSFAAGKLTAIDKVLIEFTLALSVRTVKVWDFSKFFGVSVQLGFIFFRHTFTIALLDIYGDVKRFPNQFKFEKYISLDVILVQSRREYPSCCRAGNSNIKYYFQVNFHLYVYVQFFIDLLKSTFDIPKEVYSTTILYLYNI